MVAAFRGRILFALIVASFFIARAEAADITVYAGGVKPGNILDGRGISTALDGSPVVGFRLGTDFVPHFGMEHTLSFSPDYLFPKNNFLFLAPVTNAKGIIFNSNLILSLPVGNMVPYVTAGVGLIHQYGSPDLPVGTKFAVNYGGGLKFPKLVGPLGLRFDARGYTATGLLGKKLNMLEVSGGLLLSIGH